MFGGPTATISQPEPFSDQGQNSTTPSLFVAPGFSLLPSPVGATALGASLILVQLCALRQVT